MVVPDGTNLTSDFDDTKSVNTDDIQKNFYWDKR